MALLTASEIRDMTPEQREDKLEELQLKKFKMKPGGEGTGFGDPTVHGTGNPTGDEGSGGEFREVRRTIARIKTIQQEEGDG